ncbi:MAG: hypothetical protein ACLQG3_15735 [Terracidiphilus sp.]
MRALIEKLAGIRPGFGAGFYRGFAAHFISQRIDGRIRRKGAPLRMNLHDRSDDERNQARFVNIPLAKGSQPVRRSHSGEM